MVDAIQTKSSIPLPNYQTEAAEKNLPPIGAPKDIAQTETKAADSRAETTASAFEDYLNDTSITVLEKTQTGTVFDPAAAITAGSVYGQPGGQGNI